MNKPISTSFAPNFQGDDNFLAIKLLFGITSNMVKSPIKEFKKQFALFIGNRNVFVFSSGRASIYNALLALGLKNDDEVLIQAFTCVAVPGAVVWAGLKPVFIDVDLKTYNLSVGDIKKKISPKTRVIIIQHTFGIPAQMKEILALAKEKNIIIIEDCAHSLGGEYNGKKLGSFGDISIFSFGRDKMVSSVFGGCVVVNNKKYVERVRELEEQLVNPSLWFTIQQLIYLIIYSISLPIYTLFFGKFILWFSGRSGLLSRAVYKKEHAAGKPKFVSYVLSRQLGHLLLSQFNKLGVFNKHREEISQIYIKELGLPIKKAPYLRVPYRVDNKKGLLNKAKELNIHLGNWYRGPIDPPTVDLGVFNYAPCPNAEELAKTTINLPTHIGITKEIAQKIVKFLQKNK